MKDKIEAAKETSGSKIQRIVEHIEDIVKMAEEHHDEQGFSIQTLYPMDIEALKEARRVLLSIVMPLLDDGAEFEDKIARSQTATQIVSPTPPNGEG